MVNLQKRAMVSTSKKKKGGQAKADLGQSDLNLKIKIN